MTDTIIVSGGDIQSDFAIDFLKKNIDQAGRKNIKLIAADRGLEFFIKAGEKTCFNRSFPEVQTKS